MKAAVNYIVEKEIALLSWLLERLVKKSQLQWEQTGPYSVRKTRPLEWPHIPTH